MKATRRIVLGALTGASLALLTAGAYAHPSGAGMTSESGSHAERHAAHEQRMAQHMGQHRHARGAAGGDEHAARGGAGGCPMAAQGPAQGEHKH